MGSKDAKFGLFKHCKGAGKFGCSFTSVALWTQGPGISKIDTRLWVKKLIAQGFWMFLVQCQHNQLMPFCRCPTQHFKQALRFALSALLFRWLLGGIHTPVFTKKVRVALAKVALKLMVVFDFKSFSVLFSFLCHDTKCFWVLQLRDVLNREKREIICQRE